jgi:hypothetical protein
MVAEQRARPSQIVVWRERDETRLVGIQEYTSQDTLAIDEYIHVMISRFVQTRYAVLLQQVSIQCCAVMIY